MKKTSENILKYDAVFEAQQDGGFTVSVPALPGCISEGDTFEAAKTNIAEAMTAYLESLLLDGEEIPEPDKSTFVGRIEINRPSMNVPA